MLMTLIQKEIMHHVLSVRFVALLLMCVLLIPLTLSINHRRYNQNLVDYQESVNRAQAEARENPPTGQDPNTEVSKFFLKPTPLSVFASVRFVALLLMCVLLIPLTLSINYRKYNQNLINYQESIKRAQMAAEENPPNAQDPNSEVSKLFLKPTPLSVFVNGLEDVLRFRGGTADLSWDDA
jgi:type II secretory pathway pseudopilin PulG